MTEAVTVLERTSAIGSIHVSEAFAKSLGQRVLIPSPGDDNISSSSRRNRAQADPDLGRPGEAPVPMLRQSISFGDQPITIPLATGSFTIPLSSSFNRSNSRIDSSSGRLIPVGGGSVRLSDSNPGLVDAIPHLEAEAEHKFSLEFAEEVGLSDGNPPSVTYHVRASCLAESGV